MWAPCSGTSVVADLVQTCGLEPARLLCPWDSPSQEYCSGLPCPSPGDLLNPGIEPVMSPASSASQENSSLLSHLGALRWVIPINVTTLLKTKSLHISINEIKIPINPLHANINNTFLCVKITTLSKAKRTGRDFCKSL